MRQAGVLAACGIEALTNMTARLHHDHARAATLAKHLSGIPGVLHFAVAVLLQVCCSVLQCIALRPRAYRNAFKAPLQNIWCVAVCCCSGVSGVAVCCSVALNGQANAAITGLPLRNSSVLQCRSVLQCCCSVLQCVAVCCIGVAVVLQ